VSAQLFCVGKLMIGNMFFVGVLWFHVAAFLLAILIDGFDSKRTSIF